VGLYKFYVSLEGQADAHTIPETPTKIKGVPVQRDMDLIRALLLKLEGLPMQSGGVAHITPEAEEIAIPGKTVDEIAYHLSQIENSGYIDTAGVSPMVGIGFRCLGRVTIS
jgi:Hypothetical protein (DUF2513)